MFWSDFDRREENLAAGAANGDVPYRLTVHFDDLKRQRIEVFVELDALPSFIPAPGLLNVAPHGFAMQMPKVFPVAALTRTKGDSHWVKPRHD